MLELNDLLLGISLTLGIINIIALGIWKGYDFLIRPKLKIIREIDHLEKGHVYYRIWVENRSRWNKKSIKEVTASFCVYIKEDDKRKNLIENNLVWSQNNNPIRNLGTGEKSKLDILYIASNIKRIFFICEGTHRDPQSGTVRYDQRELEKEGAPIFVEISVHSSNATQEIITFEIENPSTKSDWWNIIYQNSIPLKEGN